MSVLDNPNIRSIYCAGIGGIGVSGVAELLIRKGYRVSGSDISESPNLDRLAELGVTLYREHSSDHIADAQAFVYSSAISPKNPEYVAAQAAGIPLIRRGELLAEFMHQQRGIAVAGTHGKTTTSGLISYLLLQAKLEPTFIVGGVINSFNSPAHLGQGEWCVVEADESDASFLHLKPEIAVINNIEADHLENYENDFEKLKQAFLSFMQNISDEGVVIACLDDPVVKSLLPHCDRDIITFGFDRDADIAVEDYQQRGIETHVSVRCGDDERLDFHLNLPGRHNVCNALAAVAVAQQLGVDEAKFKDALANFPGMGRRFHSRGEIVGQHGSALLYEDYGHHPVEIQATINAARASWPDRRLVWVFQPHRYSRTQAFQDEFAAVLNTADVIFVTDIYAASELPLPGVSGETLCQRIAALDKQRPIYVSELNNLPHQLKDNLCDGDVVFLQGAGNIGAMAQEIKKIIRHPEV